MLHLLTFFAACLCLTLPAHAGPWLREKGTTFSSVSFAATYYLETASQAYLEYGLSDTTTVVADLGMARIPNGVNGGYVALSLRRSIGPADATSKWAYEMGLGVGWLGDETLPHLRTGLSWGRGKDWGEKSGWMTVEAAVYWDIKYANHIAKLDTTVGINFTDATSGMLQLYTAHVAGENIATIAPSVIITPNSKEFRIQIGSESEIGSFDNSALKIGIWREF